MIKLLFKSEHRDFQRLWIAQLISQFGDRIHQLALIALIAEKTGGSAMGLAKVIAFTILPVFIIQPFAGVFVDRLDRRATLFVCDMFRGLLVLTIPFYFIHWNSMVPIYVVVFLVFCFSRFYVPAKMSIIPDLVPAKHLVKANSLVSTTGLIAFVCGAAIGGFLIEELGAKNGFIVDAGTYFISAVFLWSMTLVWRLKVNPQKIHAAEKLVKTVSKTVFQEMREGFDYLIQHKEIRLVINILFVLLAAAGATYVVLIVFIQETFGSVTKDLGVLAVSLGVGLFIGLTAYGRFGEKVKWYKTIFYCLMLGGVMMVIFSATVYHHTNLYLAMGLAVVWGIVIGPVFIAANSVIQLLCDEDMRGKMFSALEIVIHAGFLMAMMISSWLAQYIQTVWILMGVGFIITVISVIGLMSKGVRELRC